jgi:hypothetical protein
VTAGQPVKSSRVAFCIVIVRNRFSLILKLTRQLVLAKRRTGVTPLRAGVTPLRADATYNYRLNGTYSDYIYSQLLDQ